MIKSVHVKDFQSVKDESVTLGVRESGGGLTLIVGPSSTGKSAMLRATKTLTVNGSSIPVRVGQAKTRIEAEYDDETTVAVERGKSLSTYWLNDSPYQKAGTSVPKDVENFLGLYKDAHFAFQFDPPYLLGVPGSAVTQTLGEVTNAHVLNEAVREGIRRKAEANTIAKTRRADVVEAKERLEGHRGLPARVKALEALEEMQEALNGLSAEAHAIESALSLYTRLIAEKETAEAERATVPDLSGSIKAITQHLNAIDKIGALVSEWDAAIAARHVAVAEESQAIEAVATLETKKTALLHEMGQCPTCGKKI